MIKFPKLLKIQLPILMVCMMLNSCKKEEKHDVEKPDPNYMQEILAYKNGTERSTINLEQFKTKVNVQSLGSLTSSFTTKLPVRSKLMSVNTPETYKGFMLQTDSIKVIKANGHTSYIFPVKLSSPRAITFQNLTIDESEKGTIVFINTYKPTQKWIADWKAGRPGKFEGDISVTYLDGATTIFSNGNPIGGNGKVASTNLSGKVALVDGNSGGGCSTTTYYFPIEYKCASGWHWPGDPNCSLIGSDRAGYTSVSFDLIDCSGASGGGGGTTEPTTPGDYDPCNGGGGGPVAVSDHGGKGIGNGVKGLKLMVHENPDCNPGPVLPQLPELPPRKPVQEIKNQLTDECLRATVDQALESNKNVTGFVGNLIDQYSHKNNGVVITIKNGPIDYNSQTSSHFDPNTGTFLATITFKDGHYSDVSKESVIAVLIHEVIHAYLHETNNNYRSLPREQQHGFLFQNFVNDIADYMKNKYQMPSYDAYGLAWSGMGDIFTNASDTALFDAGPGQTMTKDDIIKAIAPYNRDIESKGTPICSL